MDHHSYIHKNLTQQSNNWHQSSYLKRRCFFLNKALFLHITNGNLTLRSVIHCIKLYLRPNQVQITKLVSRIKKINKKNSTWGILTFVLMYGHGAHLCNIRHEIVGYAQRILSNIPWRVGTSWVKIPTRKQTEESNFPNCAMCSREYWHTHLTDLAFE